MAGHTAGDRRRPMIAVARSGSAVAVAARAGDRGPAAIDPVIAVFEMQVAGDQLISAARTRRRIAVAATALRHRRRIAERDLFGVTACARGVADVQQRPAVVRWMAIGAGEVESDRSFDTVGIEVQRVREPRWQGAPPDLARKWLKWRCVAGNRAARREMADGAQSPWRLRERCAMALAFITRCVFALTGPTLFLMTRLTGLPAVQHMRKSREIDGLGRCRWRATGRTTGERPDQPKCNGEDDEVAPGGRRGRAGTAHGVIVVCQEVSRFGSGGRRLLMASSRSPWSICGRCSVNMRRTATCREGWLGCHQVTAKAG